MMKEMPSVTQHLPCSCGEPTQDEALEHDADQAHAVRRSARRPEIETLS